MSDDTIGQAPWPLTEERLLATAQAALAAGPVVLGIRAPEAGDGRASEWIAATLQASGAAG